MIYDRFVGRWICIFDRIYVRRTEMGDSVQMQCTHNTYIMPLNSFILTCSTQLLMNDFVSVFLSNKKKKITLSIGSETVVEREAKQETLLCNVGDSNVWLWDVERHVVASTELASQRIFKTKKLHKNQNTDVTHAHASARARRRRTGTAEIIDEM